MGWDHNPGPCLDPPRDGPLVKVKPSVAAFLPCTRLYVLSMSAAPGSGKPTPIRKLRTAFRGPGRSDGTTFLMGPCFL